MAGFAYSHPFELMIVTTITPITALVLGVTPGAAMLAGYVGFAIGLFEHLDVRTPAWVGYIFQRPEQHSLHHERGIHAYNYGLPLWDLAFGTYRNPRTFSAHTGFWDGASARTLSMLLGRDVATPPPVAPAAPSAARAA